MTHQTVVAGKVFLGPAFGKMLDGAFLVSEKDKDIHALEVALARHCGRSFLRAWHGALLWSDFQNSRLFRARLAIRSDRILALAGIERSRRQRSVRLMEMLYTGESFGARPAQIKQGRYHLSAALFRYGTLTVFNSWGSSGRPLLQGSGECG